MLWELPSLFAFSGGLVRIQFFRRLSPDESRSKMNEEPESLGGFVFAIWFLEKHASVPFDSPYAGEVFSSAGGHRVIGAKRQPLWWLTDLC